MSPAKTSTASDSFGEIATLRIELVHTEPPIWRQVEAPTSITLKVLHDIIQQTIGWFDYHLWEFTIGDQKYGLPMDEDWGTGPRKEAIKVRLRDVIKTPTTLIEYVYDFGDCYPRYIGGEGGGPPEDCGGVTGYQDLLDARTDPDHPRHAEAMEWFEDNDPADIDELPIQYALDRLAKRRNAVKARLNKKA